MVSAHDVAAYILAKRGPMTAMKLQKLVYYSQAWALVWDEEPLFEERIEAWAGGPVVPRLYDIHRGSFTLERWLHGDADTLTTTHRATVDAVLDFYGDKPAQWLSDLTHRERPWLDARAGIPDRERGTSEITLAAMAEYYGGL